MVCLMLLERLLQHLPQLHTVGGVRAIPYMQVVLMLTADLDGDDEKDKGALDDLLAQLIAELGMNKKVGAPYCRVAASALTSTWLRVGLSFSLIWTFRTSPRKTSAAP